MDEGIRITGFLDEIFGGSQPATDDDGGSLKEKSITKHEIKDADKIAWVKNEQLNRW